MILDWEPATGRLLVSDDGVTGTEHCGPAVKGLDGIQRVRVDYEARTLFIVLTEQVAARLSFQLGVGAEESFLSTRPVVYLDQNQWSKIDAVLRGRSGVNASESAAANLFVAMAQQHRVVLPLSAGHAVETGAMYGERRVHLASTMLELSQGWLMRNPIWIKREELASAKEGRSGPAQGVFTQQADQWFTRPIREPGGFDAPEPFATMNKPVVNALSIASVLLDPTEIPDEGGRAAAADWAGVQQNAADLVRADQLSPKHARRVASAQSLADAAGELQQVWGADLEGFKRWILRSFDDISLLPLLSRVRAIFFGRLRNGSRWEGNDLTDITYLSAAAGYADLVVGERRTIGELQNATQITNGARLASSLADALAELVQLLASRQQAGVSS